MVNSTYLGIQTIHLRFLPDSFLAGSSAFLEYNEYSSQQECEHA